MSTSQTNSIDQDHLDEFDRAVLRFISANGTHKQAVDILEQRYLDFVIHASLVENHRPDQADDNGAIASSVSFMCDICSDTKFAHESFDVKGCHHSYCLDCIRNYVASKLENGISDITCPVPGCRGSLDPEYCRDIFPRDLYIRWGKSLCESVILASQKFYCPFKDCSAMMIDDGSEVVTDSKCPSCNRLFCARCKVAWHAGVDCAEYQKLSEDERGKEDLMFRNLANNKNWKRCPACKIYVERTAGCNYILCRCRVSFCYNCGAINNDHVNHRCPKCKLIYS